MRPITKLLIATSIATACSGDAQDNQTNSVDRRVRTDDKAGVAALQAALPTGSTVIAKCSDDTAGRLEGLSYNVNGQRRFRFYRPDGEYKDFADGEASGSVTCYGRVPVHANPE